MDLIFMLLKYIIYICNKLGNILLYCNFIFLVNRDCERFFVVFRKKSIGREYWWDNSL